MRWYPHESAPTYDEFCQSVCVLVTPEDLLEGQKEHGVDMTAPQLAAKWAAFRLGKKVEIRSHTETVYRGKTPGTKVYLAPL